MSKPLPVMSTVRLPLESRPRLFVVVDTEEEFDWSAPYARSNTRVSAMRQLWRVQEIFDRFTVKPTYVVDYPVADQQEGREPLQEFLAADRCVVGAHLHPWVNPPFEETLGRRASFLCNLPPELQAAKLAALVGVLGRAFGTAPRVFKAGRYGIDLATISLLDASGFQVDASLSPRMDYRGDEGPSFLDYDSQPFFVTPQLLELPLTIDYTGWAGRLRPLLHRLTLRSPVSQLRAAGALIRLGVVNRIGLSPEGNTLQEMRELTRALIGRGCRIFSLCFHSPSVVPGCTPYVRSQADLQQFLTAIERYLEFFMTEIRGLATTPLQFRAEALATGGRF